ncbi:IS982 family transposase [Desulfococcaceae bacterium HSG9]|nr:IS982 family transposase [Desulfococcaceae bacterium HSG9]
MSPNQDNVTIQTELYSEINEFVKVFQPIFQKHLIGERRQRPFCRLSVSEIMTIQVAYQIIRGQNFKSFYKDVIWQFHRNEFPSLVTYQRFVEVAPVVLMPLALFLKFRMEMSDNTGIYVIDSTPLRVCMNLRIPRHKVFKDIAQRGKSSTGWFYGFKLHMVINHVGQLMSVHISAGNSDDRKPVLRMVKNLAGKVSGDKGYIKKALAEVLLKQGPELITTVRKNMKQVLSHFNRFLLRKRAVVETANDLLKNYFQIEHSRHRSLAGFMNNVLTGLIAYTYYPNKPEMRGIDLEKSLVIVK